MGVTHAKRNGAMSVKAGGSMAEEARAADDGRSSRRGFLKRVALAGAAASALGLLARRPFGGSKRGDRSIPPSIRGAGSIFQPRNDGRHQ
jgi:hypothetical protein